MKSIFSKDISLYKRCYYIGLIAYVVLLFLAILFYKERTIFTDIAFHLFSIIKYNSLAIQNFRFGAVFTQLFPLLALKAGFSLKGIMIAYSAGFILFYFACYVLCGAVFKNYKTALLLLLFNLLFASHTFYWMQSELPQGISIMLVILAYLGNKPFEQISPISLAIIFIALFMVSFTHPLIIFPFVFSLLFFFFNNHVSIEKKMLIAIFVFYFIVLVIKNVFFKTAYENQAMGGAGNLISKFPHYFNLYSNRRLLANFVGKYYWIPLLSSIIVIVYVYKHEYFKALFFLLFMIGYILLIDVSYPDKNTTDFYIENLYLPMGIFIAIPFVYDILPLLENKKIAVATIILIIVSGCIRIYFTHNMYTARLNWERNYLKQNIGKKLLVDAQKTPVDTLFMTWGTPYEFWLLSTIENYNTASIVINDNPGQLIWALDNSKSFLTTWGTYSYSEFPGKYFIFNDTVSNYHMMK